MKAIQKVPAPIDATGVKRIIVMCQYLTKFLPNFSDKILSQRKLTDKKNHGNGLKT